MKKSLLTAAFVLVSIGTIQAQGPGRAKDSGPLPLEGKTLPDVTAHDETGAEFPLVQKLKGRHGVIVFGCLT